MKPADKHKFCKEVGKKAEEYGLQNGRDLCFMLMDVGVISENMSVEEAAGAIFRHMR